MRIKDLSKVTAWDAAYAWGLPQSSRQFRKVIDLLRPNRAKIRGEAIELSQSELFNGLVALELLSAGLEDDLVMVTAAALPSWMSSDLQADLTPGSLVVRSDESGDAFAVEYLSRADWNDFGAKAKEIIERPDNHGRKVLSVQLIDLDVIVRMMVKRIIECPERFGSDKTPGQRVAEALGQARKDVQSLIESAASI